ncbi:ABC transporter permease [Streptomyces sp. NPDC091280]|uniref:ABC transporter permease n=1 Tax=Streptomyces sp. NPDC091280 TaxID=3365984 RepID=UPI00381A3A3E
MLETVAAETAGGTAGPSRRRLRQSRHWWIAQRAGSGLLVLLAVSAVIFLATQMLPSDAARTILGKQATPELVAQLRAKLHLDQSVPSQYWQWLSHAVRGDFGQSIASQRPVTSLLTDRLENSLCLLLVVAVLMVPLSVAIGIALAVRRDRFADRTVSTVLVGLMALPDFVIGAFVLILLSTTVVAWFPSASLIPPGSNPFAHPDALVLPCLTLLLTTTPFLARMVRASVIETLESEYVAMARLRGVPERRIVWRHALPNALVPTVQGTALMLSYLLGGVVVVEYVFTYPGLGGALNDAVSFRDMPMIQAITLVFSAGVVVFNLLADILTVYLTPKLRTRGPR